MKKIDSEKNSGTETKEVKPEKKDMSKVKFTDLASLRGMGEETPAVIKREDTATILAIILISTFSILVISSLYLLFTNFNKELSEKIIEYINIVLPPVATLIGMVFGFYFSEKRLK